MRQTEPFGVAESVGLTGEEPGRIRSVLRILGLKGKRITDDSIAVHDFVHEGLPNSSLISLLDTSGLSGDEIAAAMRISHRTFQRLCDRKKATTLSPAISSELWQFAEIYARAVEVMGTPALAARWLESPALALNSRRPLDLMTTLQGAELVATVLDRLDYGVYT